MIKKNAEHGHFTQSNRYRAGIKRSLFIVFSLLLTVLLSGCSHHTAGLLNPKGLVASQERTLFFDSLALMLIVVIPVIIMSLAFAFRYRASHPTSDYRPNWSHSIFLETIWWSVPCVIIVVLGIMTWRSSHKLDPYRKLDVPGKPLLIQAVALPWKWLFIYPKQNIATDNFVELPKNRQVEFWITSDNVPMSAFFIPQLGSQIYSMAGMRTRLHLISNSEGLYEGLNTQYNGDGFSDMHFKVRVTDKKTFNNWVRKTRKASRPLNKLAYYKLTTPNKIIGKPYPVHYYSGIPKNFFMHIMDQYTKPKAHLF
jgi:cytochrome o ubiquinol oxidase subunit II